MYCQYINTTILFIGILTMTVKIIDVERTMLSTEPEMVFQKRFYVHLRKNKIYAHTHKQRQTNSKHMFALTRLSFLCINNKKILFSYCYIKLRRIYSVSSLTYFLQYLLLLMNILRFACEIKKLDFNLFYYTEQEKLMLLVYLCDTSFTLGISFLSYYSISYSFVYLKRCFYNRTSFSF